MKTIDFETIDSTNTYLKNNYQKLDNMTFVSAKSQTQGRGRNQRIWKSEKGSNLLFSLLLSKKEYIKKYKDISLISALCVCEVLNNIGIKAKIKWPNDVYVNDKKICGILLEAITKEEIECLIVGVGININQVDFGNDLLHPATSIRKELNKEIDIPSFKKAIYSCFENNLLKLINGHDFYAEIRELNYLKDKEAYALINDEKKKIKVLDINKDYSLKILVDDKIKNIISDEISFHV